MKQKHITFNKNMYLYVYKTHKLFKVSDLGQNAAKKWNMDCWWIKDIKRIFAASSFGKKYKDHCFMVHWSKVS